MKGYIHARLGKDERALLDDLKLATGCSESELVRRAMRLLARELASRRSALAAAGSSVGRFAKGPRDLSTHPRHLDGFGG